MQAAEIIARIIGPVYLIAGIGMVVNADFYRRMVEDFTKSPALICLSGYFATIFGLLILAFHRSWATDWTVLVTLIGWVALLEGAVLLIAPGLFDRIFKLFLVPPARLRYWAVVPLLMGIAFSALGYGVI